MTQTDLFTAAMSDLEGCVKDRPDGFFAVKKAPEGAERKKQALDAYNRGRDALNEYIRIVNDGLMREVNKIETM
jgi:hypothetical protein